MNIVKLKLKKNVNFYKLSKPCLHGYPGSREEVIRIFLQMRQPDSVRGIVGL